MFPPHVFSLVYFFITYPSVFSLLRMSMSPSWIRTSPGYELFIGANLVCVTYSIARAQTEHDPSYLQLLYSSPDSNLSLSETITKLYYWVLFLKCYFYYYVTNVLAREMYVEVRNATPKTGPQKLPHMIFSFTFY